MRHLLAATILLFAGALYKDVVAAAPAGPAEGAAPTRIAGLRIKRSTLNAGADDIGALHILGEVVNTSRRRVLLPQVEAKLYDANGRNFRTVSAYTSCIFHMRPRDAAPFDIQFFETRQIARFEVSVKGILSDRTAMRGVSFSDLEMSIVPAGPLAGFLQVGGFIRNRSRFDYYFPEVCVAGVSAAGRFLVVGQVPTFTPQLPAGQINQFQGQVGGYPVPTASTARFYLKVCTEADVVDGICGG